MHVQEGCKNLDKAVRDGDTLFNISWGFEDWLVTKWLQGTCRIPFRGSPVRIQKKQGSKNMVGQS